MTTTVTANIKTKDIERLHDKITRLREKEAALDAAEANNVSSHNIQRSIDSLENKVVDLQKNLVKSYRQEFVDCRDMGHLWNVKTESVEGGRMYRILACSRCHTMRDEIISRYGNVIHRQYTHPDGYLLSSPVKGTVGFSKDFWRGLQFLRRKV